jgi:hypothetical protein
MSDRRITLARWIMAVLVTALISGCSSPNSTKDNPVVTNPTITLGIEAQPAAIVADGVSRLVVFVEMKQDDQAVADSTQVILLNSMGSLGKGIVYTHAGVALDTLTSDTTAGMGWLIAYAEGVRDSAEIMFTTRQ